MDKVSRSSVRWGLVLSSVLWLTLATAAKPDAGEFLVPLQATAPTQALRQSASRVRQIQDPMTGNRVLQASTAASAIAAAVGQHTAGCRQIRFGDDGFGWVATGSATYAATDPPVAAGRNRYEARFQAFVDARARLNGCLQALSPEARQRLSERMEQNDAIRLALINLAATAEERRDEAINILGRGFVAYAVENDENAHAVRVHLVTTAKTALQLTRPIANAIEAASLREGFKQLQAEVAAGLIPPVGYRLLVVNTTGELALVGYAVQGKLRADADKIATVHATEALTGLAVGDDAAWQAALDEGPREAIRAAANGYEDAEPSARRFAQIRDLMLTAVKEDAGLQALREGRLPSSAMIKRFGGEDAIAVMVSYAPPAKKYPPPPPAPPMAPTPVEPTPPANDELAH